MLHAQVQPSHLNKKQLQIEHRLYAATALEYNIEENLDDHGHRKTKGVTHRNNDWWAKSIKNFNFSCEKDGKTSYVLEEKSL